MTLVLFQNSSTCIVAIPHSQPVITMSWKHEIAGIFPCFCKLSHNNLEIIICLYCCWYFYRLWKYSQPYSVNYLWSNIFIERLRSLFSVVVRCIPITTQLLSDIFNIYIVIRRRQSRAFRVLTLHLNQHWSTWETSAPMPTSFST